MVREMVFRWDSFELDQVSSVIEQIQAVSVPRRRLPEYEIITLKASDAVSLKEDLCSYGRFWRGLAVRHLLRLLGFNESRVLQWRLEHKLIQALIFHHYGQEAVPATRGLDAMLACGQADPWLEELSGSNPKPAIVLKRTLGYGAPLERSFELDREIVAIARERLKTNKLARTIEAETFIVQERVPLDAEFRVHTIEDRVVPGLTFRRGQPFAQSELLQAADTFVQNMLDTLPNGLVVDTFCGWDIMRTPPGKWRIIEINQSGVHKFYDPGFQCSGYFSDPNWGFAMTACLFQFVERAYGVKIEVTADPCSDQDISSFYWWIAHVLDFLRNRSHFLRLTQAVLAAPIPIIQGTDPPVAPQGVLDIRSYALELQRSLSRFGLG